MPQFWHEVVAAAPSSRRLTADDVAFVVADDDARGEVVLIVGHRAGRPRLIAGKQHGWDECGMNLYHSKHPPRQLSA